MHPLLLHLGHVAIPTYGACTALALVLVLAVSVFAAKRAGLNADKVWNLDLVAILTALFVSRIVLILGDPNVYRKHPFWLLGLLTTPNIWLALGGAFVGLLAALLYAMSAGLPLLKTADALAPAAAIAFACNRIGAFLGGSAFGTPTHLPWCVVYRSPVAYLWYRVPLGVSLHPVQVYDAGTSFLLFLLLLWMGRPGGSGRDGEIAGTWLFLYGLIRFFLEFLRGDPTRIPVLGGALTLAQTLCIVAVLFGGISWLLGSPKPTLMVADEKPTA